MAFSSILSSIFIIIFFLKFRSLKISKGEQVSFFAHFAYHIADSTPSVSHKGLTLKDLAKKSKSYLGKKWLARLLLM